MINFIIEKGKVVIDASTLTVSAFNDIWMYDKKADKSHASNMLTYVFHMKDMRDKNPFATLGASQKMPASKRNAFGNAEYKFNEDERKLVDRAMNWYDVLNKDAIERFSRAFDSKLDQATEWMEDPKNVIKTANDFEEQFKIMKTFKDMLQIKKSTDEMVREAAAKQKVQNNAARSPLSAGILD